MRQRIRYWLSHDSLGGYFLLGCVVLSLVIANSPAAGRFHSLLAAPLGAEAGPLHLRYSVLTWINDGLMAVFFLYVGLEVKEAFLTGALSSFRKASLPVLAAIGGCMLPAGIFLLFNKGTPTAGGWAIPMATDIAFALALLGIAAGKRAPLYKPFLSTLAIADDLCAIVVIALFYSGGIHAGYLAAAGGAVALQLACNKLGIKKLWVYLLSGLLLWYFLHHSGIHATLAGVLTAAAIPLPLIHPLEKRLSGPVAFGIMPVFALANTAITVSPALLATLASPLALGIGAGHVIGKPAGILLAAATGVKLKIGALPEGMRWKHLAGIGLLAGIGFTMAIFISMLSYDTTDLQQEAKLAILLTSTLAAILGTAWFRLMKH